MNIIYICFQKQPDLNWDNEKVRQDVYEMMKFWLEKELMASVWMLFLFQRRGITSC